MTLALALASPDDYLDELATRIPGRSCANAGR